MGFFNNKKEEEAVSTKSSNQQRVVSETTPVVRDNIKTPTTNLSALRESYKVKATIDGKGSLIIGGDFDGEVTIDDTLFIEKGAKFSGTAHAKNVKISGDFNGTIYSTAMEVTQSGSFSGNVNTNKAFLGGKFDGVVRSMDSIEINNNGVVDTRECKSKRIKIEGKVKGRVIASELLEVTNSGSIEGEIITKGIRTEQGGSIIGNIQTYDEHLHGGDIVLNDKSDSFDNKTQKDDDVTKLINVNPENMQKYARKESDNKGIKRIPEDKKE